MKVFLIILQVSNDYTAAKKLFSAAEGFSSTSAFFIILRYRQCLQIIVSDLVSAAAFGIEKTNINENLHPAQEMFRIQNQSAVTLISCESKQ